MVTRSVTLQTWRHRVSTCSQYQRRFELTGQFWSLAGAEALLALDTRHRNRRWHHFPHDRDRPSALTNCQRTLATSTLPLPPQLATLQFSRQRRAPDANLARFVSELLRERAMMRASQLRGGKNAVRLGLLRADLRPPVSRADRNQNIAPPA